MMNNLIEKAAGLLLVLVLLFGHPGMLSGQTEKVKLIKGGQKVDVMIGGKLFTSYQYPSNMEKPYLWPVNAPDGSVVTRGFPWNPGPGKGLIIRIISEYGSITGM